MKSEEQHQFNKYKSAYSYALFQYFRNEKIIKRNKRKFFAIIPLYILFNNLGLIS